jgi:hypothetical protein
MFLSGVPLQEQQSVKVVTIGRNTLPKSLHPIEKNLIQDQCVSTPKIASLPNKSSHGRRNETQMVKGFCYFVLFHEVL